MLMVLLCTAGLMVHQVSALAVRADLTLSLQETWKATLPLLQQLSQLTQSGSVWLLCAGHSECSVTSLH